MNSELVVSLIQKYFLVHQSPILFYIFWYSWNVQVEDYFFLLVGHQCHVKFFILFAVKLMTSKSNVNGSDWLKSTILQQYFGLGILPLKKLLL